MPGRSAAQPDEPVYTWREGARVRTVTLVRDVEALLEEKRGASARSSLALPDGQIGARSRVGDALAKQREAHRARVVLPTVRAAVAAGQPVFRDSSGSLMLLPGGVLVLLEPHVDAAGFFRASRVAGRVESRRLANLWFVRTEPGFASLELANRLADRAGVRVSQPNWWRERSLE